MVFDSILKSKEVVMIERLDEIPWHSAEAEHQRMAYKFALGLAREASTLVDDMTREGLFHWLLNKAPFTMAEENGVRHLLFMYLYA